MTKIHQLPDQTTWPDLLRGEYQPPDWEYWWNLANVTLDEAVCLSLNLDPHQCLGSTNNQSRSIKLMLARAKFYSRRDIAANNARAGTLLTSGVGACRVSLPDFSKWATGLRPPWELPESFHLAVKAHKPSMRPEIPDLLPLDESQPTPPEYCGDGLGTRQKKTYLGIIGALLKDGYAMDIHARKLSGVSDLLVELEKQGVRISDKTLRTIIKEAAELVPPR